MYACIFDANVHRGAIYGAFWVITDLKAIIPMLNIDKRQRYTCSVIYLFIFLFAVTIIRFLF